MNEQEKFEAMVNLLAELSSEGKYPEEIKNFEDVIKTSGNGEAYFGTAKEDWDMIDFPRPQLFPDKEIKFFAEYYDGFQAPFVVCGWKDSFGELERLLEGVSEELYKVYKGKVAETERKND